MGAFALAVRSVAFAAVMGMAAVTILGLASLGADRERAWEHAILESSSADRGGVHALRRTN